MTRLIPWIKGFFLILIVCLMVSCSDDVSEPEGGDTSGPGQTEQDDDTQNQNDDTDQDGDAGQSDDPDQDGDTGQTDDPDGDEGDDDNEEQPEPGSSSCVSLSPNDYACDTVVSDVSEFQTAMGTLSDNETVCLEDGTYSTGNVFIWNEGVTIRSLSGDRDAVIIDNEYRVEQGIFNVRASNVTLADITLKRAWYHGVHVGGGGHYATLHNLHLIDIRQQFVKVNPNGGGNDHGVLTCSLFELTDAGRSFIETNPSDGHQCYSGGIDAIGADGWTVSNNTFKDIYCTNGWLPTHMVLFWQESSNPLVEKNTMVNCARGIGFGLTPGDSHTGGVIKNNMIYDDGSVPGTFDVGIGLENAENVDVYNNTVYTGHYYNSIEYRFAGTTGAKIYNNLTNKTIGSRNDGEADLQNNVTQVNDDWFVDLEHGDLHLASGVVGVVGVGRPLDEVEDDMDGDARDESHPDIGADEYE